MTATALPDEAVKAMRTQAPRRRGAPAVLMTWRSLLFMHWRIDASLMRPLIPRGLEIETFDGSAWIGVVPFTMTGIRHPLLPPLPGLSAFHELNVRTYVRPAQDDRSEAAGVWFFSLDAACAPAVRSARAAYGLNYLLARMSLSRRGNLVEYDSLRAHNGAPDATFSAAWRIGDPLPPAAPGSLAHFLTERYCLYTLRRGILARADIHHTPWRLRSATLDRCRSSMISALGLSEPEIAAALPATVRNPSPGEPLLHAADELRVAAWWPRPV